MHNKIVIFGLSFGIGTLINIFLMYLVRKDFYSYEFLYKFFNNYPGSSIISMLIISSFIYYVLTLFIKDATEYTGIVKYNFGETYPATSISDLKVISKEELKIFWIL